MFDNMAPSATGEDLASVSLNDGVSNGRSRLRGNVRCRLQREIDEVRRRTLHGAWTVQSTRPQRERTLCTQFTV